MDDPVMLWFGLAVSLFGIVYGLRRTPHVRRLWDAIPTDLKPFAPVALGVTATTIEAIASGRSVRQAIAHASGGDWILAAALVAHGYHESRFARYVVEGRCHEGPAGARCDMDRSGRPRARTPRQVHAWCRASWAHPDGSTEALREGARCAARLLRMGRARCRTWEGAFAGMHSGGCTRPQAVRRVKTFRRVRSGTTKKD